MRRHLIVNMFVDYSGLKVGCHVKKIILNLFVNNVVSSS